MYTDIEKTYKEELKIVKFRNFYWKWSLFLLFPAILFENYYISLIIIPIVIIYFLFDFIEIYNKKRNLSENIKHYVQLSNSLSVNNLTVILKRYNFRTKNDIKMAIDYYNSKNPIRIESSLMGVIVSFSLTLASFVEIAYDDVSKTLDINRFILIFGTTIGIIIIILLIIGLIYWFINGIFFKSQDVCSKLSEDLTYIYLNYDKYKNQLTKKK